MSKLRIIGVDPGFANAGFCVVDLLAIGGSDLVVTKLVTTKLAPGKNVAKLADEQRRLEEIEDAFLALLDEFEPDVLAMEEPSQCLIRRKVGSKFMWAPNPKLLRTSCLMWGSIHGMCRARGIYCIKIGAKAVKKAVCGKDRASKGDIIKAVKGKYPTYQDWPTTRKVEHVADAVGVAITSFNDPAVMVMMRKLRTDA